MELVHCGRLLGLDRVAIMGILNVTPDSFFDGGRFLDRNAALERGLVMVAEGAAIIDVGGESTRPGAPSVAADEELERVIPVVEGLTERSGVVVSIDTRKPEVARLAIEAGATIINNTLGEAGAEDAGMADVALGTGAAIIEMHSRGTPETMTDLTTYGDVVAEVKEWLERRAETLTGAGIKRGAIVLDPGFGFAKSAGQSLKLLRRLGEIVALGYPVLSGTSNKSVIAAVLDLPPDERSFGTAATVAWAVGAGARIVRVHAIAPAVQVTRMVEAIMGSLLP